MGEAGGWRPGRQTLAAEVAETFLEAEDVGPGSRVAGGNGAAGARIAALEVDFSDAEAHYAALVFAVELIFPERRQVTVHTCSLRGNVNASDFERGAKALAHSIDAQAGKPVAHRLQRGGVDNRRAVGDGVVGETFGRVAHQDLLLEIHAEPFRGIFGGAGEGKGARGNVAAIAGNRERDGAEIERVCGADQVHRGRALAVDPTAVDGKERPGAVVFEAAAGPAARVSARYRIERLDRMQADTREPRQQAVSLHAKIVA